MIFATTNWVSQKVMKNLRKGLDGNARYIASKNKQHLVLMLKNQIMCQQ
jgi:hypothetical protein